ncbi:hypothetical protein BKE38_05010 [Pseudoroseomonas deserti]|uniref:Uncharacterized protein n=1 Tax=Teichococcus deserti TaxID=1817963 RepID=A0A1V2H6D2_9PROT|nr:hypothetical protein [Pseudoroseomonas deserti]ONG56955.1 hypothetical protein BKE38_05010 [Pseudoroseomonas deserti]
MTHADFLRRIMRPAAAWAEQAAGIRSSPEALRFLLAVAGQESACTHRFQILANGNAGPARSFWQGEQTGGMILVLRHGKTSAMARQLCDAASVRPEPAHVWRAIEGHDGLAYGFARLLLLTDPYKIPVDQAPAWECYAERLWRPGRPHRGAWEANWDAASVAVRAETA